jgi:pyruvate dehydrogenase E2 component (dihydrolipoamide acetyltransferase)
MFKVIMPEISDGADDITLVGWLVKETEIVKEGDDMAELVTDKASFDLPAPKSGKIARLFKEPGDKVLAGEIIAEISC